MPDDGELRGSLDDFYTVQAGAEVLGLDTSLIDSLDNDPRSMRPVSLHELIEMCCVFFSE
jgi:hypothetical protein